MLKYFTSESVTEGHPDKVCDIISDSILDEILKNDPNARVACECMASTGLVFISGEITTDCYVDIQKVARDAIKEIGYDRAKYGFDCDTCAVITAIKEQSPDIALGVDNSLEYKEGGTLADRLGAGDQGMMFGYATDETEEYMPTAIMLAHKLTRRLDTVVVSCQHSEKVNIETLRRDVKKYVIDYVIPSELVGATTKYYINPTGKFEVGGPMGDCGLTGRKIIVDTYGGYCPHGGGSFSGKDPTKVDRSGTYMARYTAKNVVAAGLAKQVQIEVAYAIGVAKPVSMHVDTFGTGVLSDEQIAKIIEKEFDFRPLAIIEKLGLRAPIYKNTASYGHFGRSEFSWEKLDKVNDLKKYLPKN